MKLQFKLYGGREPRNHAIIAARTFAQEKLEMSNIRWTAEKANEWYEGLPWLVGCNFIPSTSINQLEMWQPDTFDPGTISRELKWAADIGFNIVRVFLHNLL